MLMGKCFSNAAKSDKFIQIGLFTSIHVLRKAWWLFHGEAPMLFVL